ncbi:hypothetical protein CDEST_05274 [Colletotrichum destructivum]|uniref:Uncharacterized protein n=1 Tax=Colletotrichum destructivum TaxID=34406 RepID=A0AAX4IA36_9PEZI|nr:hypothetical protein CDEST_05274 [Colletotrichum destructivum]
MADDPVLGTIDGAPTRRGSGSDPPLGVMPFLNPFNSRRRSHSRRQLGRLKHPYSNDRRWIFRENGNVEVALIAAINNRLVTQVCIYQAVTTICSFDPDARTML